MSSLKCSTSRIKKYGDRPGDSDLTNAINLLFQIKGRLFQKQSPEFCIPVAEEFFAFARYTNDELFVLSRTTKGLRPLLPRKPPKPKHLIDFLAYILQISPSKFETPAERLNICLDIVTYAVFIYTFTKMFLQTSTQEQISLTDRTHLGSSVLANLKSPANRHVFTAPLHWFCSYHMPMLEKYKVPLTDLIYTFLQTNAFVFLAKALETCIIPEQQIVKFISSFVTTTFDKNIIVPGVFDNCLKRPLLGFLKRNSSIDVLDTGF